ncbi:uncharacterized protein IUM83_04107 [Phytophthora cinnamomi]|nr:hypothetical protein IUM83_04107 [Phytophthora cinnamomi]
MSSSSSTRRIRRLPPSKVGAGDPSISSFSTGGDFHSSDDTDRIDLGPYYELADSNIYFDIAEYEQNFAAVMQNYATSATMDAASMPFPTCYYSENFVSLLTPADIDILRKLYPTTLFGEGCVSTLYVPVAGDADAVFVECVVCSTPSGEQGSPRQPLPLTNVKTKAIVDMLGTSCMWRSCITSSDSHNLQINSNLCKWHSSLQHFLEADESMQYMPSESRMREAFLAAESDSMAEKTKYVIQTSSSLLEELSSRHLPQSIKAFFEHVLSAASNHTFQTEYVGTVVEGFASLSDLEQTYHELQRQVNLSEDIIGTENSVTRELRQLHQLTVYPGVEDSFIQRGFVDIEELQSDIRTGDLGLLLRLSQQKLQLLERRRKEEENLVVQRLAPSTSLPSMSISEQPGLSSVYDVIHVMRKGRQSLLRQQRQDALDGGRNGYKRSHGMERCASDLVYRVSPYEAKAVPTAKYRAGGGGSNGKKVTRKHSDR